VASVFLHILSASASCRGDGIFATSARMPAAEFDFAVCTDCADLNAPHRKNQTVLTDLRLHC
jgi:hypothetical protein